MQKKPRAETLKPRAQVVECLTQEIPADEGAVQHRLPGKGCKLRILQALSSLLRVAAWGIGEEGVGRMGFRVWGLLGRPSGCFILSLLGITKGPYLGKLF